MSNHSGTYSSLSDFAQVTLQITECGDVSVAHAGPDNDLVCLPNLSRPPFERRAFREFQPGHS